ncbi:hypothetical protein CJF31_00000123 [Rutstroemia sp. NJR-2017a BVV2]|nr:hypothetical protein CJF31_00000123 [Rutstroemia sp. NJR-2017a BVV2]PQE16621.1 hypothetical protein CJF30_00003321 [Rutstroemia sp. NJR-2017a BBW]PQE30710.1 hypothetical protein CJF32_00005884 [Rutstroemia sp. NJR-2017a WRK4]
MDPIEDW